MGLANPVRRGAAEFRARRAPGQGLNGRLAANRGG